MGRRRQLGRWLLIKKVLSTGLLRWVIWFHPWYPNRSKGRDTEKPYPNYRGTCTYEGGVRCGKAGYHILASWKLKATFCFMCQHLSAFSSLPGKGASVCWSCSLYRPSIKPSLRSSKWKENIPLRSQLYFFHMASFICFNLTINSLY